MVTASMEEGSATIAGYTTKASWADFGHRAEVVLHIDELPDLEARMVLAHRIGIEPKATLDLDLHRWFNGQQQGTAGLVTIERIVFSGKNIGLFVTWVQ